MMTSTEPRGAGEGQDGQRDGQGSGQPPGTPGPDTTRVPEHGGLGHRWMGLDLGSPHWRPPSFPPSRCLYLFCDSFCTWDSRHGVSLGHGGTAPLPLPAPPKPPVPPDTRSSLTQWGGGHLNTLGRSGSGSGGCECPLPRGFGVSPPPWGCPPPYPGLALAGRAGSGGGVTLEGVFPTRRTSGDPLTPQNLFSCACIQLLGVLGAWQCPHSGVTGGCMLHPSCLGLFGGGSGGGGSCCDHPRAKLWGRGTPTCQGPLGGAGIGSKLGGKHSPASAQSPPHLCPQGSSVSPRHVPGDLLLQSGSQWEPPTALAGVCTPTGSTFVWGGRDQHPAVRARGGTGPSGWIQVTPCPVLPSPPAAVLHRRGCAGDRVGSIPSAVPFHGWLTPPLAICPRGSCVCPSTLVPWLVLSLGLTNYGALDSGFTIVFKLLLKAGLGGSRRALGTSKRCGPPTAWRPPYGPSWCGFGAGGVWPPEHAKLAFACPGA